MYAVRSLYGLIFGKKVNITLFVFFMSASVMLVIYLIDYLDSAIIPNIVFKKKNYSNLFKVYNDCN